MNQDQNIDKKADEILKTLTDHMSKQKVVVDADPFAAPGTPKQLKQSDSSSKSKPMEQKQFNIEELLHIFNQN